ncbi:hypothetical protein BDA96_07G107300 [Sorghum bicolor]|uniref:Uncharacterized protein n=1 Tax=Sorghum bicolor TaxID=4558 RepID=A0A921QMG0_SORBI|nr:hypothetical protein BDA96_07G107300 [Sorghum bicolor]
MLCRMEPTGRSVSGSHRQRWSATARWFQNAYKEARNGTSPTPKNEYKVHGDLIQLPWMSFHRYMNGLMKGVSVVPGTTILQGSSVAFS